MRCDLQIVSVQYLSFTFPVPALPPEGDHLSIELSQATCSIIVTVCCSPNNARLERNEQEGA